MKILDWYILKRYLSTFFVMVLLFIPIGIIVDFSEKVDKIIANEAPLDETLAYYGNFTIYFANLLFPILLFLSVIWFTSKLANNTEIVAFLSSGVSFTRFLRPYFIGASIVCGIAIVLSMYIVPSASAGFNEYKFKYLKSSRPSERPRDVYRQINDNEVIYASNFREKSKTASNFTLEHFEGTELKYKIKADRLKLNADSTYTLKNYVKRIVGEREDVFIKENTLDTILPFDFDELTPVEYIAETLNYNELQDFIAQEKKRGSPNINRYEVVSYRRWSIPVSAFILTIIGVSVSAIKRRGGMGVNLAIGIVIGFGYIFFEKVFGSIAEESTFSPLIAVWFSNIVFGILSIYLLQKAKR
ncbi:LptF/LptG family permease [Psychroflexus salis]|uniref:Membrane protein n=1 Tax=Psychroflexus salis TaxID=1526574 RepID=A0A917EAH3_9FLAO|nr:LptF/LptG family permease [Psychroflexus salis]GGE16399.1 membrane protein [Psychroflexus salis]